MARAKRVGDYVLGHILGEGADSCVVCGQHVGTGELVAVKILDKARMLQSAGGPGRLAAEVAALRTLRHPHAVALQAVLASSSSVYLVMELVTGGDLYSLVAGGGPLPERTARRLLCQLLSVLGAAHSAGVYHRDIKPENVLLTSEGDAKLADFGLGVVVASGQDTAKGLAAGELKITSSDPMGIKDHPRAASTDKRHGHLLPSTNMDVLLDTACGTLHYSAPEVLHGRGYRGGPADVWSLGVVLYVMLAGCLPFDKDDAPTLMRSILAAEYEMPPGISPAARRLLAAMLCPDPERRISVEEIWEHDWVAAEPEAEVAAPTSVLPSLDNSGQALTTTPVIQEIEEPRSPPRCSTARMNAFQLLGANLDVSALFDPGTAPPRRGTARFSCGSNLQPIFDRMGDLVESVGGAVDQNARSG